MVHGFVLAHSILVLQRSTYHKANSFLGGITTIRIGAECFWNIHALNFGRSNFWEKVSYLVIDHMEMKTILYE